MPERPAPTACGIIRRILEPHRLFEAEMPNGFLTLAVIPNSGPQPPADPKGQRVKLTFSPFDMSHGKITRWL